MTEEKNTSDAPVCKPTKWFLWRALAMLAMFSVFAVLFFKDGMWGYREKNLHWYVHEAFVKSGKDFQKLQNEGDLTEEKWKTYVAEQPVPFPDDASEVLPRDADLDMKWPEEIAAGYSEMDKKGGQTAAARLWEDYSGERKWSAEVIEKPYTYGKIREQFIALAVTGLLVAITLFFLIRTMRRQISADEEALHTQEGKRIPYGDMVRIDKRKWDTKGIALVHYKDGETEKTAKIDGMVYGQFKEEDGAPAEKLFAYVMDRFKGEVIEYAELDEEEDSAADSSSDDDTNKDDVS